MSEVPDLVAHAIEAVEVGASSRFDGRVDVDELAGLALFDRAGARVESIDALAVSLGARPAWRRPVVAETPLSERELFVDRSVAAGRTTAEIATELGVSLRTVTSLRARVASRRQRPAVSSGSSGVGVIGRAGITRDLVRACLAGARTDVGDGGLAHLDDVVRVMVTPDARDFRIAGQARLVVVGGLPGGITVLDAVRYGAVGFVSVTTTCDALLDVVERATRGDVTMSDDVVQRMVDAIYDDRGAAATPLTVREVDVVDGIRRGESVKQTARRLGLSAKTVENRRHQLFIRYGVRSAAQLEHTLSELGLLTDPVQMER